MAIWECISWLPGFIGKMLRNENDFFLEVSCVKNYHFFTAPRWSEKALFCTIFFSPNIDSDHRSVHLRWFIWVFWAFMLKKIINFPAQCHIKVFLEFKLFWIFNFLVQITPTAIWECISWRPGFNGKMRRNKNDFFLEVSCVKNYHFFTAPRWSEKALFCTIFFSPNIDLWSQVGASRVVYLNFLRIYGEKNDKFSSTMTYRYF